MKEYERDNFNTKEFIEQWTKNVARKVDDIDEFDDEELKELSSDEKYYKEVNSFTSYFPTIISRYQKMYNQVEHTIFPEFLIKEGFEVLKILCVIEYMQEELSEYYRGDGSIYPLALKKNMEEALNLKLDSYSRRSLVVPKSHRIFSIKNKKITRALFRDIMWCITPDPDDDHLEGGVDECIDTFIEIVDSIINKIEEILKENVKEK